MILVTGATGNFGKATLDFLLKKNVPPNTIGALVRDMAKADDLKNKGIELRKGDYADYDSLVRAFEGVDKLLFISSSEINNRSKHHNNVVHAAKEAGVKHIIYTSFARKSESGSPIQTVAQSHIDTEYAIKNSGLKYTILKNALYADMLPMFMGDRVFETGIFLPAGEGRAAFTARIDMAEAAANILTGEGHTNKDYVIAASENYSLHDTARILSELSGKRVEYISPDKNTYVETLSNAGVPSVYAGLFADFSEAIKQNEFLTTEADLENLLGRKPTPLKEFLKSVYFSNN